MTKSTFGDLYNGTIDREDINCMTKSTFGDLYNGTIDREKKIKNLGYNLVTIWEKDYKNERKNNTVKN